MATDKGQQTHVEYAQQQQQQRLEWERSDTVEGTINQCARALDRGRRKHIRYVGTQLRDTLIPVLLDDKEKRPEEFDDELGDHRYWHYSELRSFMDSPEVVLAALEPNESAPEGAALTAESLDVGPTEHEAAETVKKAFLSCVAVAEQEEFVKDELTNRVDATGWTLKLGEHLQDAEMDLGDEVQIVSDQADYLKSLHCGPTGLGKSTGLEREGEDCQQLSFQEGRDCKVIDMVGFRQGESWLPDVPQQQSTLRNILEDLGLPPDFTETDDLGQPAVEILVPLTQEVPNKPFPFRIDDQEFVVRPFTVPASRLRKPLLVSLIMSRLSEGEEQTIREAYDDVDARENDWSLADLADEIRHRDELSDKHRSKAIGVLRSLQNEGFIRTEADDRTLDWQDLFHDTTTRTVFSQARCSELAGLITFAYQADTIFQKRKKMRKPPDCALLFRELWEVVPHKRRRSFDSRQAAVQEAIGQIMMRLMRQNRHIRCHLIADTQEPNDLLKSIREMFNRYVVYGANRDTIKDIFSWTQNDKWKQFWATMTPKAGEAGIVGQVDPAIENRHIEFISPVQMAPPAHHHFDVETDGTGWHARVAYSRDLDCLAEEELRRPAEIGGEEWDTTMPDELEIEPYAKSVDEGPNPEIQPLQAFVSECIRNAPGATTPKKHVYNAFNEYATEHGHDPWDFSERSVTTRFGKKFSSAVEWETKSTQTSNGDVAYQNLALSPKGEELIEREDTLT
jgi:hypothetical protein